MGDPERMAREEGAAARVLGNPRTSNPYREAQYESDFYVGLWSAWECGWVQGRRFVEERCAAREQLENVRTIMRAEARR